MERAVARHRLAWARPPAQEQNPPAQWIKPTNPRHLAHHDQGQLTAILTGCPELAAVQAHLNAFAQLMTERRGRELENG